MKFVFRIFFKTLRIVMGPFLLLGEAVTRPKGIVREHPQQVQIDQQCRSLALYQFRTCPFCIKTRQEMRRLSLNIELLDAQNNPQNRAALLAGGGRVKVPSLKITDAQGNSQWLYESGKIIEYLAKRFS